ncbi:MAG TPA: hypothetical protein VLA56_02970 [Pseudomonadales bacterium]|nr:hypothetical protein [Pseudomonadales bacterium]
MRTRIERPTRSRPARPLATLVIALATLLSATAASTAAAATDARVVATALAAQDRPVADLQRDPTSRPAAVLALADIEPGDVVVDLFAGGGYYSEILARIVGPTGRVYAHNNGAYTSFVGAVLDDRLADGRLANVVPLRTEIPDLQLPAHGIDLALMVLSWHDLYWVSDDWPAVDVDGFIAQLTAALAPDGRLLIVDHAAAAGAGIDAVDDLHRIDPAHVIATLEAHGWRLEARSDVLANPDDDHTLSVFDPSIRRHTDRFVLRFAPPAA